MKKILISIMTLSLAATAAQAQSFLDALKSVAGSSGASAVTSLLGDAIASTQTVSLAGTWTYKGVATDFSSSDAVTNIAAKASASSVESKADEALAKIGIKPGVAKFTFSKDYNFSITTGGKTINGTWSQKGSGVTLKFGKLYSFLNMDGVVKGTASGCEIVFESSKYLTFVQKVLAVVGQITGNSTISAITSLTSKVDGLKLGFKLAK